MMQLCQIQCQWQAQARSGSLSAVVNTVECTEDLFLILFLDAGTIIGDGKLELAIFGCQLYIYIFNGIFERVGNQVSNDFCYRFTVYGATYFLCWQLRA